MGQNLWLWLLCAGSITLPHRFAAIAFHPQTLSTALAPHHPDHPAFHAASECLLTEAALNSSLSPFCSFAFTLAALLHSDWTAALPSVWLQLCAECRLHQVELNHIKKTAESANDNVNI